MIKAITLLKRKNNLDVKDFRDYWLNKHVEVIKRLPGIHRYVQNHPLQENYEQGKPVYDGVAELWAEDSGVFRQMAASSAYTAVLDDEEVFIDRTSMELILTSEVVLLDGPARSTGIKLIRFMHHKPGMEIEKFQHYWRTVHGPKVIKLPMVKRHVQSHARPGGYTPDRSPVYDGVSGLWFDTSADLQQAMNSRLYADIIQDEINFTVQGEELSLTCTEHKIII